MVNKRAVPDYYNVIKEPVALSSIKVRGYPVSIEGTIWNDQSAELDIYAAKNSEERLQGFLRVRPRLCSGKLSGSMAY